MNPKIIVSINVNYVDENKQDNKPRGTYGAKQMSYLQKSKRNLPPVEEQNHTIFYSSSREVDFFNNPYTNEFVEILPNLKEEVKKNSFTSQNSFSDFFTNQEQCSRMISKKDIDPQVSLPNISYLFSIAEKTKNSKHSCSSSSTERLSSTVPLLTSSGNFSLDEYRIVKSSNENENHANQIRKTYSQNSPSYSHEVEHKQSSYLASTKENRDLLEKSSNINKSSFNLNNSYNMLKNYNKRRASPVKPSSATHNTLREKSNTKRNHTPSKVQKKRRTSCKKSWKFTYSTLCEMSPEMQSQTKKNDNLNNGYWTQEEHEAFLEGFKRYGRDWAKIAKEFVKTRKRTQVASHAQKVFFKSSESSPNSVSSLSQ